MRLDPERLLTYSFPEMRQRYTERDAILYALGVGLGQDPTDPADLAFLYESDLQVLPTMPVSMAFPGMWIREPELGIDWVHGLHYNEAATFHRPLHSCGSVLGRSRVRSVTDRGVGRGSIVLLERTIHEEGSGALVCHINQQLLLRGNDGFGGAPFRPTAPEPIPERAPDLEASFTISPRAALIYRLSGDRNPMHVDSEIAGRAGHPRPILHGLATYGVARWLVLKLFADAMPARLASLSVRFAGMVLPGDPLDFSFWQDAGQVRFVASVGDRLVLDRGRPNSGTRNVERRPARAVGEPARPGRKARLAQVCNVAASRKR